MKNAAFSVAIAMPIAVAFTTTTIVPSETITVSNFARSGLGNDSQVWFSFAGVVCTASNYTIPSDRYPCSDNVYSFYILEAANEVRYTFEIQHDLGDALLVGSFTTRCNGPWPTICGQVGSATFNLSQLL
ncbi:uncharacterized protein PG998_002995 [Apiospora kogelbergensis]|uniref:uncharacterized protein n=1 Tax=Apiospora kogelbergensis TaxID=1337665 RepID=UPI00312EE8B2